MVQVGQHRARSIAAQRVSLAARALSAIVSSLRVFGTDVGYMEDGMTERANRVGVWLGIAAIVLLLPTFTFAQETSGIAGVVKDSSGAVLPGVTVEASSPALIERVRSVVTDGEGLYKIVGLRPGVYAVTFSLTGFNSVRREGIDLPTSFTATVNASLQVGTLQETVTVSGAAPTVDVQNVVQAQVLSRELMNAIPAGNKTSVSLGMMVPGMVTPNADVGGTAKGTPVMAIHGTRSSEQIQRFDGMYFNNGRGQGGSNTAITPNDATLQEVAIGIGSASAEFAMSGVQANLIPRDGGNTFSGVYYGALSHQNLLPSTNLGPDLINQGLTSVDKIQYVYDVDPAFGGPLRKDKLWFYGSWRIWSVKYTVGGIGYNKSPIPWIYDPDPNQPAYELDRDTNASLRLTWQITPRSKLVIHPQYNTNLRNPQYSGGAGTRTTAPEAQTNFQGRPSTFDMVSWTSPITSRLLFEAGWAYASKDPQQLLQPGQDANTPSWTEASTGYVWGSRTSPYGVNGGLRVYLEGRRVVCDRFPCPQSGMGPPAWPDPNRPKCHRWPDDATVVDGGAESGDGLCHAFGVPGSLEI